MRALFIAAALSLTLLAGCSGQLVKLSEDHRKTLTTEQVHAVHLSQLGFLVESTGYTIAGVLFSPLVAIGQAAEGMSMLNDLGLEDPAPRVKDRVLAALDEHYRLPNVIRVAQPIQRFSAEPYKSLKGVVLEVRTTHWGIDNNRAKYAAGVRVVRLADEVILWEAVCNEVIADKNQPSPASEALRADKGALLKAKLNQAAGTCADQLAAWAVDRAAR